LNKNNLYYEIKESVNTEGVSDKEAIGLFMEGSSLRSSCWWSSLKLRAIDIDGWKNHWDFFSKRHEGMFYNEEHYNEEHKDSPEPFTANTAKTCPGIANILKNSFLIKSPSDLVLSVKDDGSYLWDASNDLLDISEHITSQFYTEKNNIFKGKIALKILLPVFIGTTGTPWIILQPMYHNSVNYAITNGVVSDKHTKYQELNIIFLVDIPKKGKSTTIHIKKGDVISYLWLPKKMKLTKNNKMNGKINALSRVWGKGLQG
jgi:hypothetical protein